MHCYAWFLRPCQCRVYVGFRRVPYSLSNPAFNQLSDMEEVSSPVQRPSEPHVDRCRYFFTVSTLLLRSALSSRPLFLAMAGGRQSETGGDPKGRTQWEPRRAQIKRCGPDPKTFSSTRSHRTSGTTTWPLTFCLCLSFICTLVFGGRASTSTLRLSERIARIRIWYADFLGAIEVV